MYEPHWVRLVLRVGKGPDDPHQNYISFAELMKHRFRDSQRAPTTAHNTWWVGVVRLIFHLLFGTVKGRGKTR